MDAFETLKTLMEIPGPTGRERPVMDWLREAWEPKVERVWSSRVGNLLAHVGGQGPKLLIQGHADELSFVVKYIDDDGFLWLSNGQAPSTDVTHRYPVGQPALVISRTAQLDGLFAAASGHILTRQQRERNQVTTDDLFVDIGASSREEAAGMGVHVGAAIIWNPPVRKLGTRIYGKAIDDRVALALMTLLLDGLDTSALTYDLYFAATIQEEIGLGGALSLRHDVDADLAIALDNGLVGDIPTVATRNMPVVLGGGPTLVYKDAGIHYDVRIIDHLSDIADREGIPVQHAVYEQIGSDGSALIKQGIPTALLGPSTRYTHSAFEMIDERDVDHSLRLLQAFITAEPVVMHE
ncbi:MAG TPA: M20/M25/M40 family metallo-hydrolase [Thermomicrobiales bacterium]|nr:M20/M25/M40 family metallo-hydrolase [Thermomicrobiales bacterium]